MLSQVKKTEFINSSSRLVLFIFLAVSFIIIIHDIIPKMKNIDVHMSNLRKTGNNFSQRTTPTLLSTEITKHILSFTNSTFNRSNIKLETTIQCVGSLYNQSCLYKNLYYINSRFTILTVKGRHLPPYSIRTNAFIFWHATPNKRIFDTYSDLEKFVRTKMKPKVIPSVTLYFGQLWHFNIGHALFDGLYPAYLALIRFPPRHLHPFRILAAIDDCNDCWAEDVYSRFGGLGILKANDLSDMSVEKWFVFDEVVMGSGTMCQRCTQPNLQLPGGVELDGSRLFRDRMYQQHGLIPSVVRHKSSSEGRTSHDVLLAHVFHNKRFTDNDQKEIKDAMNEINSYTNSHLNKTISNTIKLEWPLINVTYLFYDQIKGQNSNSSQINATAMDSRSPTYELIDNNFMAQLKILYRTDINIIGPGTGQMYQTFLSDGSVNINLGGIRPWGLENTDQAYTSYLEQHMTSGAPYLKGLYYPINERTKGIKKDEVIKLIRQAGQLILGGFSLPVNPLENLAPDGQLFVEMCEKDKTFCSLVTTRSEKTDFPCIDLWVEDLVHEHRQWKLGGVIINGHNVSCPFNRALLHELRSKYGIQHKSSNQWLKQFR